MRVFNVRALYDRYANGKKNDEVEGKYSIKTSQEQDAEDAIKLCREHIQKKAVYTDDPESIVSKSDKLEAKRITFLEVVQLAETDN
jgi:hypothetical protein